MSVIFKKARNTEKMTMNNYIKEFKSQNGNVNFTTKELVQGLHTRIDNMEEMFCNRLNEISSRKVSNTVFWPIISAGFGAIFYLLTVGGVK